MPSPVYPKAQRLNKSLTFPDTSTVREPSANNFLEKLIRLLDDAFRKLFDDIKDSRIYRYTPTSSSDTTGKEGDQAYDNSFLYTKTQGGWRRVAHSSF
jgi:hypothetical protein